jgi:hypothetical protein
MSLPPHQASKAHGMRARRSPNRYEIFIVGPRSRVCMWERIAGGRHVYSSGRYFMNPHQALKSINQDLSDFPNNAREVWLVG